MPVAPEHAAGGPYYFALSDADEPTFGAEHHRYDEYVMSFSMPQKEGDFATLSVDIKNPRKGLYAPGQQIYVWFAKDREDSVGGVQPLFRGRMVGLPSNLLDEVITIQFTARPEDLAAQKAALAESLRELPMYDEVFTDPSQRDDPDQVLQGYSALWHYDRVTHVVTKSDILAGEEGIINFPDNLYDNVQINLDPLSQSSIDIDASVTWQQQASGEVDFGSKVFESYTAEAMASGWPKPGTNLQSGWSVADSSVTVTGNLDLPMVEWQASYQNQQEKHRDGDTMSVQESFSGPLGVTAQSGITLTFGGVNVVGDPTTGTPARASIQRTAAVIGLAGNVVTTLVLRYDADRKREEHLKFTLVADLQPVIHADDSSESSGPVVINGVDVGVPIGEGSDQESPIGGDLSRSSYFVTERGLRSVEHLICRARARLLFAARVGRVSWECPIDQAIDLNCRKNARLHDPRVAGGEALGKIIAYELTGDGDSGVFIGRLTIGCAVGKDTVVTEDPGSDEYIDDDYVDDYYTRDGEIVFASPAGDVGYSPPVFAVGDDLVFPLTKAQVLVREEVTNSIEDQEEVVAVSTAPPGQFNNPNSIDAQKARGESIVKAIVDALERNVTKYELELKSVTGGPFVSEYDVTTTILSIPKQIDLAATGL